MPKPKPVSWLRGGLALACLWLASCGYLLQRGHVARTFNSRFGCGGAKATRVADGYRVVGCGRSAEYVCVPDAVPERHDYKYDPHDRVAEAIGSVVFAALLAGTNEHCRLAYSEPLSGVSMPVASAAPAPVRRTRAAPGELVLKTRVLFAAGHLSARAKPSEHPVHALLIVHANARLPVGTCRAQIFHDGVEVPVLDQVRVDPFEVQLLVPIAALAGAENAVRFAGSVCGLTFDLDASGRSTLGLFAVHFREQLAKDAALRAATLPAAAGP